MNKKIKSFRLARLLFCTIFAQIFAQVLVQTPFQILSPTLALAAQANTEPSLKGILPNTKSEDTSDTVTFIKPALSALISITRTTDPYSLDTEGARPISLDEVVRNAIDNNLDIGIGRMNELSKTALYQASLGKFLPDLNLSYNYNYLKGRADLPFIGLGTPGLHFNNPIIIANAGFTYHVFRGGSILFGAMRAKENYRAARHAQHATINDTLLQSAKLYYDLMLQESILMARIAAVQTSEEQLKMNNDLRAGGLATSLDTYQAETQLSTDRQNLIDQQIARRNAAIKLAQYLNIEQGIDLLSGSRQMQKIRLVGINLRPPDLLKIAIDSRPELKQYEQLRLAAKRQINIELAKLVPSFDFNGNVYGVGETLGPATRSITTNVIAIAPGGGSIVSTPITINSDRRISAIWSIGYTIRWNLAGLGMVDWSNTQSAKFLARQAQLQQQQVLNQVIADVRQSYLSTLSTENLLQETNARVKSSTEELRLAILRFRYGLGKNIDVLRAQQDYTSALIEKARALENFNIAQVQLLRDIGVLSPATVTARTPYSG